MKKNRTRLNQFFAALFIVLVSLCSTAFADPRNSTSLDIEIIPDKDAYKRDEIALLTINVKNTSTIVATNVTLENILPEGLMYAGNAPVSMFTHAHLLPNESVSHLVRVKVADKSIPMTGDPYNPQIWSYLLIGLLGILSMLFVTIWWKHRMISKASQE